ncbi:MFS transporter [Limnohabitans sp.]|uniref:MFS transporter n=1 Tax=Limnohabitans sp. TaxID=1907725 RepID=UPI00286FA32A|nr:MFS transporter [Limnohabitans sp.]
MPTLKNLLTHRSFVRFMGARFLVVTANQMLMVAVAWHMYDLTGSAWDLGLVGLFQFVPALVLTLPAGHVADRVHRGRLFAACVAIQASVSMLLVWATMGEFVSRDLILTLSIVLGGTRAFQMPAQQALTPMLVPSSVLQRAIALSSSALQAATIGGPALGGLLYARGALTVYAVCVVMMLMSSALTLTVRYVHHVRHDAVSWASAMAGVTFVWRNKILLGATSLDLFAVLLGGATALLPIYARDVLHTGPEGLGLLRAAPAAGALLMSFAMLRWPLYRHVGYSLLGAVAVFGGATIVFGLSHHFGLSLLALAVTGAADNISVVTRLTLTQLQTPDEIRGRVAAVNSIFIGASNQLGEFESGTVAALWGPVVSVVSGGVGTVIVAVAWLKLFPTLARRDRMQ